MAKRKDSLVVGIPILLTALVLWEFSIGMGCAFSSAYLRIDSGTRGTARSCVEDVVEGAHHPVETARDGLIEVHLQGGNWLEAQVGTIREAVALSRVVGEACRLPAQRFSIELDLGGGPAGFLQSPV